MNNRVQQRFDRSIREALEEIEASRRDKWAAAMQRRAARNVSTPAQGPKKLATAKHRHLYLENEGTVLFVGKKSECPKCARARKG